MTKIKLAKFILLNLILVSVICIPQNVNSSDKLFYSEINTLLNLEKDTRAGEGNYQETAKATFEMIATYLEEKGAAITKMNKDIDAKIELYKDLKKRTDALIASKEIPQSVIARITQGQQSIFRDENTLVLCKSKFENVITQETGRLSKLWSRLGLFAKGLAKGADIAEITDSLLTIKNANTSDEDYYDVKLKESVDIAKSVLSLIGADNPATLAAEIEVEAASIVIDLIGDELRELANINSSNIRSLTDQFNNDVRNALERILKNAKGKNIIDCENEAKTAISKIAANAYDRLKPSTGDVYKAVFGETPAETFLMLLVDGSSGGSLCRSYNVALDFMSQLSFKESAELARFLEKRNFRNKIIKTLELYKAIDEINIIAKQLEETPPLNVVKVQNTIMLPQIPTQPTPGAKITTLTASSYNITAGTGNVSFSATTSSEAGGVSLTIYNNGVKERVIDLPSANKKNWDSALENFETPGICTIIASVKDKTGKLVAGGDFGPITVTVKPLAYVSAISAAPDPVSLGGNVTFTATVKNVVAVNAKVVLKLDNYEVAMEPSGNTYKKTLQITEALPDGTRTYTAYVRENGVSSAAPAAKTIKFTIGGAISTVTAYMAGKPTTTFTRGEPIDFVVRLSTPTIGQIILMLDTYSVPMSKQADGSWKGTTKIYDIPADGKRNFWAYVREGSQNGPQTEPKTLKMIGPGASKLSCTPQNVNKGDTLTISVVKGNSAHVVKGYFLDKNGAQVPIPFKAKTLEEWVYSPRITESGRGIKKFNVTVEDKGKIVETFSCDVAFNGAALPAPTDTDGMEQGFSLTDSDISITKNRINHVAWEIKVNVHKLPQAPRALYVAIQFPEGGVQLPGMPNNAPIQLALGYPGRDNNMNFIANRSTDRDVPFNIVVYFMGETKPFFKTSRDFIPGEVNSGALVKTLYESFANAYSAMNESSVMSLISDQWEAGDGTTLADLSGTLRNTFKIFNTVKCTISNLNVTPKGEPGKFIARYDIAITARNYKYNIPHEEKSSVEEEVTIENGRPKITKTMSGRFWYVQ